jgi:hypothetical protein
MTSHDHSESGHVHCHSFGEAVMKDMPGLQFSAPPGVENEHCAPFAHWPFKISSR